MWVSVGLGGRGWERVGSHLFKQRKGGGASGYEEGDSAGYVA